MKKTLYLKFTSIILVICFLLSTLLTVTALIPFSELSVTDKETDNHISSDSNITTEEYKLLPIITGDCCTRKIYNMEILAGMLCVQERG